MLNFVLWLVAGGLMGGAASLLKGADARQGRLLNITVGVFGAYVAGLALSPLSGISTLHESRFSFPGLMISLLGAILLLAAVNLFQRWIVR